MEFKGRSLGITICEDAWNSPSFWSKPLYHTDPVQSLIDQGANLIVNISASPFESDKPQFRYRMLLDHVRKHKVPLVFLNLVGGNDDLLFDGNSLVLGRNGNLVAQGRSFAEDLFVADPDSDADREYRLGMEEESLQFTNTYKHDQYGNQVYMMYVHTDGEAWGERTVYEY